MDCSLPGSSVHGTCPWDSPWTRILEWVPCPSSGDLPDPGIEPRSPALQADSLPSELPGEPCTSTLFMCLVAQSCLTLCHPMDCSPPGSYGPWDSPGKNTGVGSHSLLQGIFLTQELNQGFLHCRGILYQLNYQGRLHRLYRH